MFRIASPAAAALAVLVLAVTSGGGASDKWSPQATTQPSITGTLTEGQKLTAVVGEWQSRGSTSLALQWVRCVTTATSSCTPIPDQTATSYALTTADVGKVLRLAVTATNNWGSTTETSDPTDIVAPTPVAPPTKATAPSISLAPSITGTAKQGQTLSASTGTWNGTGPITYAYQWFYCDQAGSKCAPIVGYTQATYTPVVYDVGGRDKVRVTATNSAGSSEAYSSLTEVVAAPSSGSNTAATGPSVATPPSISGSAQQGKTLTASTGSWNGTAPMTYAYQWFYCDQTGSKCSPIVGYTQATYTPVVYDVGGRNKVLRQRHQQRRQLRGVLGAHRCRRKRVGPDSSDTAAVESHTAAVESHTAPVESHTAPVESHTAAAERHGTERRHGSDRLRHGPAGSAVDGVDGHVERHRTDDVRVPVVLLRPDGQQLLADRRVHPGHVFAGRVGRRGPQQGPRHRDEQRRERRGVLPAYRRRHRQDRE